MYYDSLKNAYTFNLIKVKVTLVQALSLCTIYKTFFARVILNRGRRILKQRSVN